MLLDDHTQSVETREEVRVVPTAMTIANRPLNEALMLLLTLAMSLARDRT